MTKSLILTGFISFLLLNIFSSCKDDNPVDNSISLQDIYFTQYQNGNINIYTISQTGANKQLVKNGFAIIDEPHASSMLAAKFGQYGYTELTVMNLMGGNTVTLPISEYKPVYAGLSTGASKVFFTCDEGNYLFVINSDGTGLTQISNNILGTEQSVDFSPDGTKIAFIESPPGVNASLVVSNVDGTNKIILKDSITYLYGFTLDWAKDGSRIAFQNTLTSGIVSIFAINSDGTNLKNLTNANKHDDCPSWSGNGNYLAFMSYDSTGMQDGIFIINSDGSNKRLIVSAAEGEYFSQPQWYMSENKILFTSTVNNTNRKIKIYDIQTNSLTIVTDDSPLNAYWNYTMLIPLL